MRSKITAVVLALCVMLTLLSACGKGADTPAESASPSPAEESVSPSPEASPSAEPALTVDYQAAYATHAPDQLMFTVDGSDVTWGEYFYWLYFVMNQIETYVGPVTDWDADSPFSEESLSYRDFVSDYAYNMCRQYHVIENRAAEIGAELTDEDVAGMDEFWQTNVDSYEGGEPELLEYLDTIFLTKDMFYQFNRVSYLYDRTFEKLYGVKGAELSDDEVSSFIDANGYMMAKHILISTVDDAGEALSDEEKAAKLKTAEDILAQINAASDKTAKFNELMASSEDPGLASYPDGYIFGSGEMVAEFENAVQGLGDNEISEIVESSYGYHIICRLPVELDGVVQYDENTSEPVTLRYAAALSQFNTVYSDWLESAVVEETPEYEAVDISVLFAAK